MAFHESFYINFLSSTAGNKPNVYFYLFFSDAPSKPVFAIKEEITSRDNSEHGEEEMEVDSDDEESKSQNAPTHAQMSRSLNPAGTFNTLSSLSSLKPGRMCDNKQYLCVNGFWFQIRKTMVLFL